VESSNPSVRTGHALSLRKQHEHLPHPFGERVGERGNSLQKKPPRRCQHPSNEGDFDEVTISSET